MPAVRLGRKIYNSSKEIREGQRTQRKNDDAPKGGGKLHLVGDEVGACADKNPEDFIARAFASGHWSDWPDAITLAHDLNFIVRNGYEY